MLRSTGNVKLPSMINIGTCFLDAIFNLLLIFPTATYKILGLSITVPGADLGVAGAALGTILAELVSTCLLLWFLVVKSDKIALVGHPGSFLPEIFCMRRVLRIGSPIAVERMAMSGAQIVTTMIVAPWVLCLWQPILLPSLLRVCVTCRVTELLMQHPPS
mgnify:FL=1